jgi:hypothetical protein
MQGEMEVCGGTSTDSDSSDQQQYCFPAMGEKIMFYRGRISALDRSRMFVRLSFSVNQRAIVHPHNQQAAVRRAILRSRLLESPNLICVICFF